MKELSIEEKAKAYDMALENAKHYHSEMGDDICCVLEECFPILNESEDERIRKAIHIYLDWLDGRKDCAPKGEYSIKDMIAWLEKQWSESNDVVKCLINGMKFYYEDNPEATWGTEKFSMKVKDILSWLEKHNQIMTKSPQLGEQEPAETANRSPQEESNPNKKPQRIISAEAKEAMYDKPSWSEEDNELSCFESALFTAFSYTWQSYLLGEEVNVKQWAKEQSKELLEAAKEELKGNNTAWSEEDESIALGIEQIVNCASLLNIAPDRLNKVRNWLKSLKGRVQPQTTWKPSDKQIEALESATENCAYSEYQDCLRELIEQLKKLKR